MILGLSGAKGSGKDTVAAYLVKTHGFERKAFADPLKKSVAALFDIPFAMVDKLKNDESAFTSIYQLSPAKDQYEAAGRELISQHDMTFRTFLQRYGTESHRDVFGEDFWVDITLPVQGYYPGRAIVVSDVRFPNEANRVTQLGGYNVRIFRDAVIPEESIDPLHKSEHFDFGYDFTILNNGGLDDLAVSCEEILTLAGHHSFVDK